MRNKKDNRKGFLKDGFSGAARQAEAMATPIAEGRMRVSRMKGSGREPKEMAVDLRRWDGVDLHLVNDGILTIRPIDDDDVVSMLQTRSAFRGFVSALRDLLNYDIVDVYDAERTEEE